MRKPYAGSDCAEEEMPVEAEAVPMSLRELLPRLPYALS